MNEYRTIKDLVIGTCASEEAFSFPSYERLTSLVRKHFPTSKWKETHYAWYKSQIKRGGISVPGWDDPRDPEVEVGGTEEEVEDAVEASLSLERDLHTYLAQRVDSLEPGLTLVEDGVEYQTEAGRIDLLAKDPVENLVVIELKAGKAKDAALGQLLGYIGCVSIGRSVVRGILVASSFEPRVIFAAKALPNVKLIKYQVAFELHEIE
jgi:hypothetical protein